MKQQLKLVLVPILVALLAGCGGVVKLKLAEIDNGGDTYPTVSVANARSGDMTNLAPSETVVFAQGTDTALARTNVVDIIFTETVSVSPSASNNRYSDGDRNAVSVHVPMFRLTATKYVKDENDHWSLSRELDLTNPKTKYDHFRFRIMALNSGDKPFNGDLTIYDNLDGRLTFSAVASAVTVHDQRKTKEGVSYIPFIGGFIASAMDDFPVRNPKAEVNVIPKGQLLVFQFPKVLLEENDGVVVEIDVDAKLPSIDEMRQTSVPIRQN